MSSVSSSFLHYGSKADIDESLLTSKLCRWTARAASDVLKREVMDLLPEAEEAKTTEGLQVLSTYEVERRKALTRGKYLYKSNGRAVSEDERKIRDRKFSTKLELKRRREDDNLGPLSKPAAKRGRLGSSPQTPISNQSSGVLESPPQQPEATNTVGNPSTDDIPSEDFQLDYRFVDPQSPLQQLRIQAALFYPRAHYHALTGEYPPHTSAGTYADQYLAISTLLAQNWLMEGDYFPSLAEIGPWSGFDMVPTAPLPDEVMQLILHPAAVTSSVSETSTTYPYDTRGSSAAFGAEDVQTFPNFNSGLESDGDLNVWSDDLFKEYMQDSEDVEGEEE